MKQCKNCGEQVQVEEAEKEGLKIFKCVECGQEYLFDPTVVEDDLTPEEMDEASTEAMKEVLDKHEEEKEEEQQQVIIPKEKDKDTPECKHCGKPMKEAPGQVDADWLCNNNGCEGAFKEEELVEDDEDGDLLWG